MNPVITLDVGGQCFRATKATLCSVNGYFSAMLSDDGEWQESMDYKEPIFVDRGMPVE